MQSSKPYRKFSTRSDNLQVKIPSFVPVLLSITKGYENHIPQHHMKFFINVLFAHMDSLVHRVLCYDMPDCNPIPSGPIILLFTYSGPIILCSPYSVLIQSVRHYFNICMLIAFMGLTLFVLLTTGG